MSRKLITKLALAVMLAAACLVFSSAPAAAQCAMCRTALSNSPETAKLAQNFNYAVLVLLIPPVLLFCGIFIAAYKFRKAPGQSPAPGAEERSLPRLWLSRLGARLRHRQPEQEEGGRRAGLSFH